jgi:hypothetical protein
LSSSDSGGSAGSSGAGTACSGSAAATVRGFSTWPMEVPRKPICEVEAGGRSKLVSTMASTTSPAIVAPKPSQKFLPMFIIAWLPSRGLDRPRADRPAGRSARSPCLTAQRYQLSTTVPVRRMPMPPVSGVSTANHQAQRWMLSKVALKPMVQRQKIAQRSCAVPRSITCSTSRSDPKRPAARMVAPCIANSSVDP